MPKRKFLFRKKGVGVWPKIFYIFWIFAKKLCQANEIAHWSDMEVFHAQLESFDNHRWQMEEAIRRINDNDEYDKDDEDDNTHTISFVSINEPHITFVA